MRTNTQILTWSPWANPWKPSNVSRESYLTALRRRHLEHLVLSKGAEELCSKIQFNSQEDNGGLGGRRDSLETSTLVVFLSHVFGQG